MILITNFKINETKYYTYSNKPERNLAVFEIIKNFMKINSHHYTMRECEWASFLYGKAAISAKEQALANIDDTVLGTLPEILQQEAKEWRLEIAVLKDEWETIQRTISLAKELIALPKEEAAYFRQSGTSELAISRVAESLNRMIREGIFKTWVHPSLFLEVKETSY